VLVHCALYTWYWRGPSCSRRLYETGSNEPQLQQVWPLGRQPTASLSTGPRLPFLVGLGDTAVDFDFAPPVPSRKVSLFHCNYFFVPQLRNSFIGEVSSVARSVMAEVCTCVPLFVFRRLNISCYFFNCVVYRPCLLLRSVLDEWMIMERS
jgi:hypothetical protein